METQEKAGYLGNKLPKMRLSDLIEMGLRDIEQCECDGIRIDMGRWHGSRKQLKRDGVPECAVCFGGAVMACELGVPQRHDWTHNGDVIDPHSNWHDVVPGDFVDKVTVAQLCAMDSLRQGRIHEACYKLKETHPELWNESRECPNLPGWASGWDGLRVTHYADSPVAFKAQMKLLAQILKRSDGL